MGLRATALNPVSKYEVCGEVRLIVRASETPRATGLSLPCLAVFPGLPLVWFVP